MQRTPQMKLQDLKGKLQRLINDRAATEGEKSVARLKLSRINLELELLRQKVQDHNRTMNRHGFVPNPSVDPRQPNAGFSFKNRHESDEGEPRKYDYKSPPRYQRAKHSKRAWRDIEETALNQQAYHARHWNSLFGVTPEANRARLEKDNKLEALVKDIKLINNITLINGKLTKRLLFWNTDTMQKYWYIIERDTVTGKTQKSKRYWSRDGALLAHSDDHITWVQTEYT